MFSSIYLAPFLGEGQIKERNIGFLGKIAIKKE
jgi:hypothetical protein